MHRFIRSATVSAILVCVAVPAWAQRPRPQRPYRGLFGGGVGATEQLLTATASLGGGFSDNLVVGLRGGGRPRVSDANTSFRGGSAQFSGSLSYSLDLRRVTVNANAGTTASYFPSLGIGILRRDSARVNASAQLASWLSANAFASYRPFSLSPLFAADPEASPQDADAPVADLPSSLSNYITYGGGLSHRRQLSRRMSFTANYTYRARESSFDEGRFQRQGAGAQLTYNVAKGLDVRAGYRYSVAQYPGKESGLDNHLIDAGVNFNRNLSLSLSRRTLVSFGTGMAGTTRENLEETVPDRPTQLQFRLIGNVSLIHEIGRTWSAGAQYNRSVRFDESWPEPISTDSVTAAVGGLIGRRVQSQSNIGTSRGRSGFDRTGGGFNGYYATSRLGFGLNRYVNMGLLYMYYRQRIGQAVLLAPGFAGSLNRQAVNAYLTVWAPLFQR